MNYKTNVNMQRLLALLIFLMPFGITKAQTLENVFIQNVPVIDSAKSVKSMSEASSRLDIAAGKWNIEWIANYYAAYAKILISFQETKTDQKDILLKQAEIYFDRIKGLNVQNDEVDALYALLINAKTAVDPQSRGAQNASALSAYLKKAKDKNADNPRIYYVKGLSLFYTPKAFGGGADAAKPFFEKAALLFRKDSTSFLKPHWGKGINDYYLSQCK